MQKNECGGDRIHIINQPRTVERHIANIYEKLKVRNRRELILKLLPEK
jgi:DNA-binding NarL/FixJ family response regulator